MYDLPGHLVGRREIRHELHPPVPMSSFHYHSQHDDFLMHRAAAGMTYSPVFFVLAGGGSVHPVLLSRSRRDRRQDSVAKKIQQMVVKLRFIILNMPGMPLPLSDDRISSRNFFAASRNVFPVLTSPARYLPRSSRYQSSAKSFARSRLSSLVLMRQFLPAR